MSKKTTPSFVFMIDAVRSANLKSIHCVVVKSGSNYKVLSYFEWLNTNKKALYEHNPLL